MVTEESHSQAPFHSGCSSPAQGPSLFTEEVTLNHQPVPENAVFLKCWSLVQSCSPHPGSWGTQLRGPFSLHSGGLQLTAWSTLWATVWD